MNSNTFVESPIISMEQPSIHLNLTMVSPPPAVSPLEYMMRPEIQLPTLPIGENESNQILMPSVSPYQHKNEINSANQLSSLKSNVKPHVLLEKPPEVRVLKVSKADIKALSQVISEFQEQFVGY